MGILAGQTVAITGATGFLGGHLVLACRAAGASVRAVVRSPDKARWMADLGVDVRIADLSDVAAMTAAFRGSDAVIANAARTVARGGSLADSLRDNRDGAQNQLVASADAGVQRVLYISTIAVYATWPFHQTDETRPLRDPDRTPVDPGAWASSPQYARSKAAAELEVWRVADERGLHVTSLRPGPIFGAGWARLSDNYRRWVGQHVALLPTARFPHVHAADCAEACVVALTAASAVGEAYNLAGPPASPYAVVGALSRHAGRGPLRVPVFAPLWMALDDRKVEALLGRPLKNVLDHPADVLDADIQDGAASRYSGLR